MSKPSIGLRETQKTFFDEVISRYENGEGWRFAINLVLVAGGAVLAAIGKLSLLAEPHASWVTAIGVTMVFVGSALVAIFDRNRTALTTSARAALELAQDMQDERRLLEEQILAADLLDRRRRFLLQAQQSMQEAVERVPLGTDIVTVIDAMLDAGANDLEGAIGFDPGEKWTFSIFRREPEVPGKAPEVMRRISFTWADRSHEKREGRSWKKNEGCTGVSWQRDAEVIEADLRKPEVAGQYVVPLKLRKDDDDDRYVSVAVIPIRVGPQDEMWGSVTATSNISGRWQRVATSPREQNVLALRMMAQLIAMQVALRSPV